MSTVAQNCQAHCKVAQFDWALEHLGRDSMDFERVLVQIDNVNLKIAGTTLLHISCYHKHLKALSSLLKRGADFTTKNDKGNTAIHEIIYDMFFIYIQDEALISDIRNNELINSVLKAHIETGNVENPVSAYGLSHFHIASMANHVKVIELFLSAGVNVNEPVNLDAILFSKYTPLHFAVRAYSCETAKLLLERGADAKLKDVKGLTPLHLVILKQFKLTEKLENEKNYAEIEQLKKYKKENEKLIKLFLKDNSGIDVNNKDLCRLHLACILDDSSFAERLLSLDVNVNCAVSMDSAKWPGYTALHFASHFNINTVKLLLKNGANIATTDAQEISPFDICVKKYELKDLHIILSMVPIIRDIFFSDNETKLTDFINATQSYSAFDTFFERTPENLLLPKHSPLWPGYCLSHLVVLFFKRDNDSRLGSPVICNADLCLSFHNIQDAHGRAPIHLAFYKKNNNIIDLFFEQNSAISDVVDNDGLSYLHIACLRKNNRVVTHLLSKNADPNCIYKGKTLSTIIGEGYSPLHCAVSRMDVKIVEELLQHQIDVNVTDANGMTPIHYILTVCSSIIGKNIGTLLFSSCQLMNVVDSKTGLSHLHVACFIGNEDAVERLLKLGADPNATYSFEPRSTETSRSSLSHQRARVLTRTPLHLGIVYNHTKVVKILLQNGADILHKGSEDTPLFYQILNPRATGLPRKFDGECTRKYFASMLFNNVELQQRVKDDTGITSLHVACVLCDTDQIEKLLTDSQSDINAQIHSNSPIWCYKTPLHLLLSFGNNLKRMKDAMKLLLDYDANVTLQDIRGDTPLHSFFRRRKLLSYDNGEFPHYDVLRLLWKYHDDFSLNPVNEEGISHFHIACFASEYEIVEEFLESGVDVNLPIGFQDRRVTFQTPLHAVLQSRLDGQGDTRKHLHTIDVLLSYGADVNAQGGNCSTALIQAVRKGPSREKFLEKLIKAGADINFTNLNGQSALEILFSSTERVTEEELSFLIKNRISLNIFNSVDGTGLVSIIYLINDQNRKLIFDKILDTSDLFTINEMGRTPIHNIVANDFAFLSNEDYFSSIEKFIQMGYDIDVQDSTGKTALHLAASFHNEVALSALLIAGADINITDEKGEPAITKNFQVRYTWNLRLKQVPRPMKQNVALHIVTLRLCDLEVHPENLKLANSLARKNIFKSHCKQVSEEIEMTKFVRIGTGSLTLKNFLSETGAIAARPMIPSEADRQAIDEFFRSINIKRFPNLKYLFKLQYRKMLARLKLMEAATDSVKVLFGCSNGFFMPEMCCRMVIRFLANTEIKNLISALSKR